MTNDTRFGKVSAAAIFDDRLTNAQLRVLAALATYADGTTGECWPFAANVAERLGITPRTLRKHVAALCALGYVDRVAQFERDGGQTRNLYRLRSDPPPPVAQWPTPPDPPGAQWPTPPDPPGASYPPPPVAQWPTNNRPQSNNNLGGAALTRDIAAHDDRPELQKRDHHPIDDLLAHIAEAQHGSSGPDVVDLDRERRRRDHSATQEAADPPHGHDPADRPTSPHSAAVNRERGA